MLNTYPFTPPHKCFTYLHPIRVEDSRKAEFVLIGAFLPLTWVHIYPTFAQQRKAADYFMLTQRTFFPETLLNLEDLTMTKKPNFVEFEFVTLRLTDEQIADFEVWSKSNFSRIWQMLNDLAEAGYKHSTSPDLENVCHISTLTATQYAAHNQKHCLSSRSDDLIEAVLLSCYKHFVLSDGGQWAGSQSRKNWG